MKRGKEVYGSWNIGNLTAVVCVSGAGAQSQYKSNVRGKSADEISISKVNCGDDGVTSAAGGYFAFWVRPACHIQHCSVLAHTLIEWNKLFPFTDQLRCVTTYVCVCPLCFGLFWADSQKKHTTAHFLCDLCQTFWWLSTSGSICFPGITDVVHFYHITLTEIEFPLMHFYVS